MTLLRLKRIITVYLLLFWWERTDRAINKQYLRIYRTRT